MKKLLVVPVAGILVLAGFGASALAGAGTWPVNCARQATTSSMTCVESYLNSLHRTDRTLGSMTLTLLHQQGSLNTRLSNLENAVACINNVLPVTQYHGYGYDSNGDGVVDTTTTALDMTHQGDDAGEFLAVINAACIKPTPHGYRFTPRR